MLFLLPFVVIVRFAISFPVFSQPPSSSLSFRSSAFPVTAQHRRGGLVEVDRFVMSSVMDDRLSPSLEAVEWIGTGVDRW